jgi:3-oxoacyl-ACP reductase-like protein
MLALLSVQWMCNNSTAEGKIAAADAAAAAPANAAAAAPAIAAAATMHVLMPLSCLSCYVADAVKPRPKQRSATHTAGTMLSRDVGGKST